jgi:uncharacterized membrane protein YcaP (DUF421 family)
VPSAPRRGEVEGTISSTDRSAWLVDILRGTEWKARLAMTNAIDWSELFGFTMNPLELVIRGTAMFWFLYLLFRFILRRDVGSVAMADILILVIIADASQNAMAGEYKSVTDGIVLVSTIILWNIAVDWMAYKSKRFRTILEPKLLVLIRNGRINYPALNQQFMSIDDLKGKLREAGVDDIKKVKLASFESSGEFSVVKK